MCVVRLSLLRGKPNAYLDAVSAAIHEALVDSYGMAAGDLFQVFQQVDPAEFRYSRDYGGGPRSESFMLLNILGPERPVAVKQAFYKRVVELLNDRAGVRPEDVFVSLQAAQTSDWSFGSGTSLVPEEHDAS